MEQQLNLLGTPSFVVFERWALLGIQILPFNPEFVEVDGSHFSQSTREMGTQGF